MSFYIYGLRVIGDTECRYIGMTGKRVEDRLAAHLAAASGPRRDLSPLLDWLSENAGKVEAFKIGKVETEADARATERTMIAFALRLGQRLFNRWHVPTELRIGWTGYFTAKQVSVGKAA